LTCATYLRRHGSVVVEASWNRTIIIGCGVVVGIGPVARRARARVAKLAGPVAPYR
jgi:hypothetical protein